jgi:hypothetical protein
VRTAEEHALTAPPVLVLKPDRRGWSVECTCGWQSETFDDRLAADVTGAEHLAAPAPARSRMFGRRSRTAL